MGSINEEIWSFHALLNSDGLVDATWYRRNKAAYEIVTYVNHVIALYLADQPIGVAIFVARAYEFLSSDASSCVTSKYSQAVYAYLHVMVRWLRERPEFNEELLPILPAGLLEKATDSPMKQ